MIDVSYLFILPSTFLQRISVSAKYSKILDDFNINRRCAPNFSVHLRFKGDRDGEGDGDGN